MLNIENVCSFGPKGNKNRSCDNCHGQEHDTEQPGNEPNLPREASKRPKKSLFSSLFQSSSAAQKPQTQSTRFGFGSKAVVIAAVGALALTAAVPSIRRRLPARNGAPDWIQAAAMDYSDSSDSSDNQEGPSYIPPGAIAVPMNNLYIGALSNVQQTGFTLVGQPDEPINDLVDLGISHILSVQSLGGSEDKTIDKLKKAKIEHKFYGFHDNKHTDIKGALEGTKDFIKEGMSNGNKLLVHCMAGQNRSVSLVLAYLIKYGKDIREQGYTFRQAWDVVKAGRPHAMPHDSTAQKLLDLEKEIYGTNSMEPGELAGVQATMGELLLEFQNTSRSYTNEDIWEKPEKGMPVPEKKCCCL